MKQPQTPFVGPKPSMVSRRVSSSGSILASSRKDRSSNEDTIPRIASTESFTSSSISTHATNTSELELNSFHTKKRKSHQLSSSIDDSKHHNSSSGHNKIKHSSDEKNRSSNSSRGNIGSSRDQREQSSRPRGSTHVMEKIQTSLEPMTQMAIEIKGALLACGIASICYLLHWLKMVLIPFFLAIFLMYLVDPVVEIIDVSPKYFCCVCTKRWRDRRRTSRGCSRALASLCAIAIVCIFFFIVGYVIVQSVENLDIKAYKAGYATLLQQLDGLLTKMGIKFNFTSAINDNLEKLAKFVLGECIDFLSTSFVVLIYLTYFLCTRVRPGHAGGVWARIDRDIQRFVTLKAYLSLAVAVFVTIVYLSLDVGLAVVWGILTFVLNWIPNFGALLASTLPIAMIAISPHEIMNPWEKFFAILIPASLHVFIGNFIEPKVFGTRLEMDPVVVVISLSIWGLLWGITGMMLSVPLTAAFKIMISQLKMWPSVVALIEGRYFLSRNALNSSSSDDAAALPLSSFSYSSSFSGANEARYKRVLDKEEDDDDDNDACLVEVEVDRENGHKNMNKNDEKINMDMNDNVNDNYGEDEDDHRHHHLPPPLHHLPHTVGIHRPPG